MWRHDSMSDADVFQLLRGRTIMMAGNRRQRIYGQLDCRSGKRMRRANRVFFADATSAVVAGYRPCGHCLPDHYRQWQAESDGE